MEALSLSERARTYAIACHEQCAQLYDGQYSYAFHLQMVADAALPFIRDEDAETRELILAGCWCHDLIEDARQSYNDVKQALGETVAEIAYALTNEKGRSRAERANARYYAGIRMTPHATLVKICDRIANVQYSKAQGGKAWIRYREEQPHFRASLYQPGQYEEAWAELDSLFENRTTIA